MPVSERGVFAVVGAGPKGIAVAVKAKVLEEFGLPVDRVVIIEKNGVAAHWSGDFGYTNGELKLGTSPEKDVVFPLQTDVGDQRLNEEIRKRLMDFTWGAFLVQTQRFSDWVDRGRPAPCHKFWAAYLQWVSDQLAPQIRIISGEVTGIGLTADQKRWDLAIKAGDGPVVSLEADRLMLTGPGKTRMDFQVGGQGHLPEGAYDLESFWSALKSKTFPEKGRLAIVGAGENAASALLALMKDYPGIQVEVISPKGFISTRAENYYENQFFSQPVKNGWRQLKLSDRVDFIERTDLGVFSVHAMRLLNEETRHQIVPGRVIELKERKSWSRRCSLMLEYGNKIMERDYDHVVLATGFNHTLLMSSLFKPKALKALEKSMGAPLESAELSSRIQSDLSVKGIGPALHLPMLAGLAQGPGFANLSCLGLLSDRVVLEPVRERLRESPKKPRVATKWERVGASI